ncbi:MAG TPA: cytochrome c biogenesis protein CcsA [Bacillota bacterium]|nr:cytochrome c biogenesis protein CcsA [Bacillota bacterium]
MANLQYILFWAALAAYTLAWAGSLAGVIFRKVKLDRVGLVCALTGLVLHAVSLTLRSVAIGHLPLFGTYENSQVCAWFIALFTIIIYLKYSGLKFIGALTHLWVVALMLWSLNFNRKMIPLTISEQSLWVDFHVLFAWLAFGSLFAAWGLALLFLLQPRQRFRLAGDAAELAELQFRFLTFGYIVYTVMIALGAIYSFLLFGQWWQWDIVETLSLVTWLLYGLIIHIFLFYPRRLVLAAWLLLVAPLGILLSYLGLSALGVQTFHNFDLPF